MNHSIVWPDVMAMVEEFCHENCVMERIKKSRLFLVKHQGADRVEDFHLISLSNSIYLIIAKVLANRLREMIDELAGPFQSAIIPGRQLVDGVVVAGKIIVAWGRKDTKGFI